MHAPMFLGQTEDGLVASALDVMALLPSICSPLGAVALLPALLHLVTSVLKNCKSLESASSRAALGCLRAYASHPYSLLPQTETAYGRLMQSCAARLLDWAKAGGEAADRLDPLVLLSAVTEMVLTTRPGLLSCPALLYPSLNAFQQSLQSDDALLRLHAIRLFDKLLRDAKKQLSEDAKSLVLTPYVHALAPKVRRLTTRSTPSPPLIEYLSNNDDVSYSSAVAAQIVAHLCSPASRNVESQEQLLITIESLNCVEALAALAESEHCKFRQPKKNFI